MSEITADNPGRCVDCKWVDIYCVNDDSLFFACIRSRHIDSIQRIEFEESYFESCSKYIFKKLRSQCNCLLQDGTYGFEPVEVLAR